MRAPDEGQVADLPAITADVLARVRARAPRVHCITNAVAQTFTANMLLAAGAVPSMTIAPAEIGAFVARADGLLVNLGTFDTERRAAVDVAIEAAGERVPWVLDPVFIDRARRAGGLCQDAGREGAARHSPQRGRVRRARRRRAWRRRARCYAREHHAVVGLTGADRHRHRWRPARAHQQRPSADGPGDGHGLRRVGAGRRLPRGRARSPGARPRRGSSRSGSRAKSRRGAREVPAVLRSRSSMRCMASTARCCSNGRG